MRFFAKEQASFASTPFTLTTLQFTVLSFDLVRLWSASVHLSLSYRKIACSVVVAPFSPSIIMSKTLDDDRTPLKESFEADDLPDLEQGAFPCYSDPYYGTNSFALVGVQQKLPGEPPEVENFKRDIIQRAREHCGLSLTEVGTLVSRPQPLSLTKPLKKWIEQNVPEVRVGDDGKIVPTPWKDLFLTGITGGGAPACNSCCHSRRIKRSIFLVGCVLNWLFAVLFCAAMVVEQRIGGGRTNFGVAVAIVIILVSIAVQLTKACCAMWCNRMERCAVEQDDDPRTCDWHDRSIMRANHKFWDRRIELVIGTIAAS